MKSVTCSICLNKVDVPDEQAVKGKIQCPYCLGFFAGVAAYELENIDEAIKGCCQGEESCESCKLGECPIGYAKKLTAQAAAEGTGNIVDGASEIPQGDQVDFKDFDPDELKESLVEILSTCHSCQEHHHDDCIVNIVRGCIETALLGERVPYRGSVALYLDDLTALKQEVGAELVKQYRKSAVGA